MTSGRLVEYEGGGEETRSNPWLAELQQEMFIEINPKVAAEKGIRNGERAWVHTPTGAKLNVQALVTERVGPDTVFMPFHFSGHWQGADMLAYYPQGRAPDRARRGDQHRHHLRLRQRDDDAGNQDDDLQRREGIREESPWHE